MAWAMNGAGEGWVEPFLFSLALWILLPVTFIKVSKGQRRGENSALDRKLLWAAALLDTLLIAMTLLDGGENFGRAMKFVPAYVYIWILMWLSWQIIAIRPFLRRRARTPK